MKRYEMQQNGRHWDIIDTQTGRVMVEGETMQICDNILTSLDGTSPVPEWDEACEVAELIAYENGGEWSLQLIDG